MTFDLFVKDEHKADEYRSWVKRILSVSETLQIPYDSLWQMPEYEFTILEDIAILNIKKQQEKTSQLQEMRNKNGR